jgi:hypothetical protein
MVRTPGRTVLFLLLLSLSSILLTLGEGLYLMSEQTVKKLESVFTTIGTVQQTHDEMTAQKVWDTEKKAYLDVASHAEYHSIIPVEKLYFEGANYIHPPVHRPYYGATHPDFTYRDDSYIRVMAQTRDRLPIVEVTPLQDCVPDHTVRLKLLRELYGRNGAAGREVQEWETILFCDHYNPNPKTLYAGKTYVMALEWRRSHAEWQRTHTGVDRLSGEYFPRSSDTNYGLSTQYLPDGKKIPEQFPMQERWDVVTEGFYDTPEGQRWLELAKAMEQLEHTIPVIPTDSTKLLMSFFNGNATIIDGRDISEKEYQSGKRVCLISQELSQMHGYSVGDTVPLPLFFADYRDSASRDFPPDSLPIGIPNHPLNAEGKAYQVFDDNQYVVVGIYNEINKATSSSGYDMAGYGVVVPAASIRSSDENNILDYGPMMGYNTVFQIPNGTIDQFRKAWEKQGIDGLEINFFDKGFTSLKESLDKIKQIALALSVAGIMVSILILLLFCHLFIGKQKKRTAIERSLGMNKLSCTTSLLAGILVIALLGSAIGSVIGYIFTGSAMSLFTSQAQGQIYSTAFSSWASAGGELNELPFEAGAVSPIVCLFTIAYLLVLSFGIALAQIRQNLKSEPLKLLSMREN